MIDISTRYLGLELRNPIIAGAGSLTADMRTIHEIEEAGAGALVTQSLFEEEIQLERLKMEEDREKFSHRNPEMITIFPELEHRGPREHLYWVEKTKKELSIPVIASLNAVETGTWVKYAALLEETGVDALELNFYAAPEKNHRDARSMEQHQLDLLAKVQRRVSIPVGVKLSPFYTSPLQFISRMDDVGVRGVVLFNRMFHPDIDIDRQENTSDHHLSGPTDHRLPLKYTGLLSPRIQADICSSTGIFQGEDVIKMTLAGASSVQVVSTLYKNGISHLRKMIGAIESWMKARGYRSLDDFRGKLNHKNSRNPWTYTRAQYVKMLLHPEELLENLPVP